MATELPSPIAAVEPVDVRRGGGRRGRGRGRSGGAGPGGAVAVNFVLVLLVAAAAGGGWFIFEQQDELRRASQALTDAQQRIGALEDRLRLTDQELLDSGEDMGAKLAFWESEIRKVWDIANKRNKGRIEDNQAEIAKLDESVAALTAAQQNVKSAVGRLEGTAAEQLEAAQRINELDAAVQRMVRDQRDLVDKANAAANVASRLEARVRENEQAVEAIDAHRARINADLAELRRRLPAAL